MTNIEGWAVFGPRLLLRQIDQATSSSGLSKPESAAEVGLMQGQLCEIVGISALEQSSPYWNTFRVGQRVYVAKYKGAMVEIDGEELVVVDIETDVLLYQKGGAA